MLSGEKIKKARQSLDMTVGDLADHIVRGGLKKKKAVSAVKNWEKGLIKPRPRREDIDRLAQALSVEVNDILDWKSSCNYAPMSPHKARQVTDLIIGRHVQDALDILKFEHRRAASVISKVLKAAIADADEQNADVENLFVVRANVDDAGIRLGTKRWIPKDRGRAHPIRKKACHVHVTISEEE